MARGDHPGIMGRPRIEIDWDEFHKLCLIQCTLVEIAGWFDCSEDTIENRVKETHGVTFSEYYKKKSAKGKISLRRTQMRMSETNPTMAIWLGKQYLGQKDQQDFSGNIKVAKAFDTGKMTKPEYMEFIKDQIRIESKELEKETEG